MTPNKGDDGVAANSASEERLAAGNKPKTTAPPPEDPSQPLTTPMTSDGSATPASTSGTTAAATPVPAKGGKNPKGPKEKDPPKGAAGGKVSKAECRQLFDKYIELTVGSDSRFEGIPPEMIAQLKQSALSQAQSEKGDPCSTQEVTRTQYNCAITAPTTQAWQRCMK
jgi:hypothetical protein